MKISSQQLTFKNTEPIKFMALLDAENAVWNNSVFSGLREASHANQGKGSTRPQSTDCSIGVLLACSSKHIS